VGDPSPSRAANVLPFVHRRWQACPDRRSRAALAGDYGPWTAP
jgi:hypothetical protein